ncbi:MAG: histidine phosphatase family protein [Kiloniellales bacterium]
MTEDAVVTRWWWIRHAPVNSGGRIYGQNDMPADCSDPALFRRLATLVPAEAVWVTSHLQRTRQTAEAILAHRPASEDDERELGRLPSFLAEAALAEQHLGDWQGRSHAELRAQRDGAWHRFWLSPAHEAPPGGESFQQLIERVGPVVAKLTREHAGRNIVAVTHGGTIRAALAIALGLEAERVLSFSIDNCSLTRIDHIAGAPGSHAPDLTEAWRVACVNLMARDPD